MAAAAGCRSDAGAVICCERLAAALSDCSLFRAGWRSQLPGVNDVRLPTTLCGTRPRRWFSPPSTSLSMLSRMNLNAESAAARTSLDLKPQVSGLAMRRELKAHRWRACSSTHTGQREWSVAEAETAAAATCQTHATERREWSVAVVGVGSCWVPAACRCMWGADSLPGGQSSC